MLGLYKILEFIEARYMKKFLEKQKKEILEGREEGEERYLGKYEVKPARFKGIYRTEGGSFLSFDGEDLIPIDSKHLELPTQSLSIAKINVFVPSSAVTSEEFYRFLSESIESEKRRSYGRG
jgi:hypothetical protein